MLEQSFQHKLVTSTMTKLDILDDSHDLVGSIVQDADVIRESLNDLYVCADEDEPLSIDDINKAIQYAQSIVELSMSLRNNLEQLLP